MARTEDQSTDPTEPEMPLAASEPAATSGDVLVASNEQASVWHCGGVGDDYRVERGEAVYFVHFEHSPEFTRARAIDLAGITQ